MKPCAIIPARGGSKGIPRKNLQMINGKSLLRRAVETCLRADVEVLVSTDDDEIGKEAMRSGATVRRRPKNLAVDEAHSWPVLQDAAEHSTDAKILLWVQCTAPLMTPLDIRACLDELPGCDVAVAVCPSTAFLLNHRGEPVNVTFPIQRRQDCGHQYAIAGSVWAFRRSHLKAAHPYDGKVGIVASENPMRLEIDTKHDLDVARAICL